MTIATLLLTCLFFLAMGWTEAAHYVTALSVGAIVCVACATAGATAQDLKTGYLVGGTPRLQQYAIIIGALASALALGPVLLKLNDAATVYVPVEQVAPGLHMEASASVTKLPLEQLQGPQAAQDSNSYYAWHNTDGSVAPAGKYLVDEHGAAVYLVDPGINGTHTQRPDGSEVRKFEAPKAVLVSYIIKGILDRELPWAVGVYLPLSSSAPMFIGGLIRGLVDYRRRREPAFAALSAEQQTAAGDRGEGVLLASGYIAGGALAGIVIAFSAGVYLAFDHAVGAWASAHNPLFAGDYADLLSLLPFAVLAAALYWVGRRATQ